MFLEHLLFSHGSKFSGGTSFPLTGEVDERRWPEYGIVKTRVE
jgi:hypothetical protein